MLDQILATLDAPKFDINALIVFPAKSWDFAILVGQTVSMVENGYPDAYDAMDYQDYAREVYMDARRGGHPDTTFKAMLADLKEFQG